MEPARKPQRDIEPDIKPDLRVFGDGETSTSGGQGRAADDAESLRDYEAGGDGERPNETGEDAVNRAESEGTSGPWADRTTPRAAEEAVTFTKKIVTKAFWQRAAPLLGLSGIIGIIIFLLGGWLPTMLVPSLSQGAVSENDTRGTLIERRLIAKLQQKMTDSGPCDTRLSLCSNKKMPKLMLQSMARKGIVAVDAAGKPVTIDGTSGYVDDNPTHYQYKDRDGTTKMIRASEFVDTYKSNAFFRSTFKGAYNARYIAYTGGFMKKIFDKWGVKKDGGVMSDTEFTEETARQKVAEATKAGASDTSESGAKNTFRERAKLLFQRSADKVGKTGGDPILIIGTGICMGISMPTFIASTIRAVQIAQVVVLASDFLLSAGDMIRSGDATGAQSAALGKTLTDRYKDEESGETKAAVDSQILLAAAGAATGAVLKPNARMPGYGIFSSPGIQASSQIANNPAVKDTCNTINSPQAAVASAGITGALGAATGGIGAAVKLALQGMIKVSLIFGAIGVAMTILEQTGVFDIIAEFAFGIAKDLIGNMYEDAQGLPLGDAFGAGLFAVFSLAALGGGAAVLTKAQASKFKSVTLEVDNEYREEAVATLSPFDVSSQYTFLGSIVSKLAISTAGSTGTVSSALSVVGSIARAPFQLFTHSASAEVDPIEAKFGYAEYYGVNEEIGVTVAGTAATGMPVEYLDMDANQAAELVSDSFDPYTGEPYEPTGQDETLGGPNSDIATTIADCQDMDLESMSGCTVKSSSTTVAPTEVCDDKGVCTAGTSVTVSGDVSELRSAAIRTYYIDYQLESVFNGKDKLEEAATPTSTAGVSIDMANLYKDSTDVACAQNTIDVGTNTGYNQGAAFPVRLCALPNSTEPSKEGGMAVVNSRVSGAAYAMLEQMKTDLAAEMGDDFLARTVGSNKIPFGDSYRSPELQQAAIDDCGLYANGGCAAAQGYSNHQSGVALDFEYNNNYCVHSRGIRTCPASPFWRWLDANADKYGFKNGVDEWWHWSPTGG